MKKCCLRAGLLCFFWAGAWANAAAQTYTFTTIAGAPGVSGSVDGTNSDARFLGPAGLARDNAGSLYVADLSNHLIRQVAPVGSDWVVTTVAGLARTPGSADGTNSDARFNRPSSVAVDDAGNLLVTDNYNQTIRKITRSGTNWVVSTIAGVAGVAGSDDGTNNQALFHGPQALAAAPGNTFYLTDRLNFTIRSLQLLDTNWVTRTIAGTPSIYGGFVDGFDGAAAFNFPFGITRHTNANLYVADFGNNAIRRIVPMGPDWLTTTVAGFSGTTGTNDGPASTAKFNSPNGIAVDLSETLYVADQYNNTIRKIAPAGNSWTVSTFAGAPGQAGTNDGPAAVARFYRPWGIVLDPAGNLFVVDSFNHTIRKGTLQQAIAPSLQIFLAASQAVIAWPTTATNFVLETSAALGAAASWSSVTTGIVSSGGYNFFTNALGTAPAFFRLHNPSAGPAL